MFNRVRHSLPVGSRLNGVRRTCQPQPRAISQRSIPSFLAPNRPLAPRPPDRAGGSSAERISNLSSASANPAAASPCPTRGLVAEPVSFVGFPGRWYTAQGERGGCVPQRSRPSVSRTFLKSWGATMEQYAGIVGIGSAFVGLIVGYLIGYRSGQVAGELAALKSMQHRHGRENSSLRHRRTSEENHDPSS